MFQKLKKFLETEMRMSHIYQPVMIKTLLSKKGSAEVSTIAKQLLSYDTSQQEYITKRGKKIWSHRHLSNEPIPGSKRYEVLKKAKGKCELCGVSNKEKSLDVDHIIPRSKKGTNEISNLQALCFTCNRQKRNLDASDFRNLSEFFALRQNDCIFCEPKRKKVIDNSYACAIKDNYPVTKDHHLVIPKRHVSDYFELERSEINSINEILFQLREKLLKKDKKISGFNIGINSGKLAGQTIFHCHVHLIPRRKGDVKNPRGGIRGVMLNKQFY